MEAEHVANAEAEQLAHQEGMVSRSSFKMTLTDGEITSC